MRSLVLALVALALLATPASAAVIEIEDHFCGCDGSSGDEDTRGIIVRAAPGEVNRMTIRRSPRGVVIEDLGAPLTGACRPSSSGGRFCRGQFDGAEVYLGDGDDRVWADGTSPRWFACVRSSPAVGGCSACDSAAACL